MHTIQHDGQLEPITARERAWVHELIREVQEHEHRKSIVGRLVEWEVATRQFLKAEWLTVWTSENEPTDEIVQWHRKCLGPLLTTGRSLLSLTNGVPQTELEGAGTNRQEIEATVHHLQNSLDSWHHPISLEALAVTKEKLVASAT